MGYKCKPLGECGPISLAYRITLEGMFGTSTFDAYGIDEQEALDAVVDYVVDCEMNVYFEHYELFDLCEVGQTVEEYAQANGLTHCGKYGVYVKVISIEELRGYNYEI